MAGKTLDRAEKELRKTAFKYPNIREDHPWGESAFKVKEKVFLFLSRHDGGLSLSMKLPVSGPEVLTMPFAQPTGYGLGKSGWVTLRFVEGEAVPVELIREWLAESFRAVAPKKVVAEWESGSAEQK